MHASTLARERGQAALIAVLLLLGIVTTVIVYVLANPAQLSLERDKKTTDALAQARDALIGRAAADSSMPGSLPCPDLLTNIAGNNIPNDGIADLLVGNECPSYIGRLPWRTLGLPDLRDGSGERLWYALSRAFRDDSSAQPLNSNTLGQFQISIGSTTYTQVIAVVFAPGGVVGVQTRSAANENTVAHYLEGGNETGVSTNTFVTSVETESFNDKLLPLTNDALFNVVNIRVAKEVVAALESYRSSNSYYPSANDYGSAAPYYCNPSSYRGRFPITTTGGTCGQAAWPASTSTFRTWFSNNNWNLVTHYAISKACGRLGLPFGLDSIVMDACDLLGNLSSVLGLINTVLNLLSLPTLADEALTITGVSSNVRTLVIVSGRMNTSIPQAYPCNSSTTTTNCMEDNENRNGGLVYTKPARFPASNDRMAVSCATNSPCSVIP